MARISSACFLQSIRAFASRSDFGLELLAQARARKAIVEKAKTPPYSSRTSAIITALRFPPRLRYDYQSGERRIPPDMWRLDRRTFAPMIGLTATVEAYAGIKATWPAYMQT
jgi:hypothetical protein